MKLKFFKAVASTGNIKATIHSSGKLGFSTQAIKLLGIDENSYLKIAINEENGEDENLYVIHTKLQDEEAIKVAKAGDYYYLNSKPIFDKLEIDYKRSKIIYDIVEIEYEGNKLYKFVRREKDRKKIK